MSGVEGFSARGAPPGWAAVGAGSDGRLVAELATEARRRLLAVRERDGVKGSDLEDALGDVTSHDFLMTALAASWPADPPQRGAGPIRLPVSRTRQPALAQDLTARIDGELLVMGSAGVKAMRC